MKKLLFALLVSIAIPSIAQVDEANLKQHIKILSADSLQGRGTGSEGERMAARYIESQFKKMKLQPKGQSTGFRQSFLFKGGVHGTGTEGTANNLIGFIDNKAAQTIVIGAHYDHLGLAENGSSLDANPQGKIHNGADDNASGVAG